jgi:hypothetical protein
MADPELAAPILDTLKADSSLYVRKSVANHLNDITKLHPEWVLKRLKSWPLENPHTAWIARHALRTLIKQGDKQALGVIGAGKKAAVSISGFTVNPKKLTLGERLDAVVHAAIDLAPEPAPGGGLRHPLRQKGRQQFGQSLQTQGADAGRR